MSNITPMTVPVETAERDLQHLLERLHLGETITRRARQNAQSEALTNFLLACMGASRQGHNPETCLHKAWEEIADTIEGKTPYSAAVLDCINLHCQTLGKS